MVSLIQFCSMHTGYAKQLPTPVNFSCLLHGMLQGAVLEQASSVPRCQCCEAHHVDEPCLTLGLISAGQNPYYPFAGTKDVSEHARPPVALNARDSPAYNAVVKPIMSVADPIDAASVVYT